MVCGSSVRCQKSSSRALSVAAAAAADAAAVAAVSAAAAISAALADGDGDVITVAAITVSAPDTVGGGIAAVASGGASQCHRCFCRHASAAAATVDGGTADFAAAAPMLPLLPLPPILPRLLLPALGR